MTKRQKRNKAAEFTQEGVIRGDVEKRGAHSHQFVVTGYGPGIS